MELTGNLAGIKGGKIIFGAVLVILCIGLGQVILLDPDTAIVLVLALVVGFFVVKQPLVGILLVLVTTSTIISPQVLPKASIMGADIEFTEVLIVMALGTVFMKYGTLGSLRRCFSSRLTIPLIIFLSLVFISVFYSLSIYRNLEVTTVLARSRNLFYYSLFFPTFLALRNEKDLRVFIKGLLVITALVSIYFVYTAVFGQTYLHYLLRTGVRFAVTSVDTGHVSDTILRHARMRDIPGTSIVVTMFFVAVGLFVYHYSTRGIIWYGSLSALFTIPVLLTFTRTTWATFLFAFPILWYLVRKKTFRLTKLVFIMGGGFLLIFLALALHPKYSEIIGFTKDRLKSFFEENVETSTAVWRIVEIKAALDEVEESPLTGIGVGGEIEHKKVKYKGKEYILTNSFGIHNSFLSLALMTGIPALIVYLTIYFLALTGALLTFKKSENLFVKGIAIGMFLSLLRTLWNAFTQQYFLEVSMIPCLAISFALIEAMRTAEMQTEREKSEKGSDLVVSKTIYPRPY